MQPWTKWQKKNTQYQFTNIFKFKEMDENNWKELREIAENEHLFFLNITSELIEKPCFLMTKILL